MKTGGNSYVVESGRRFGRPDPDLQRIIKADEAVFEMEKTPEKRLALAKEIGDLQYKVDRLREQIEALSRID
jgi:hypothetical protein